METSSRSSATEPRWLPPSAAVEFNRQVVEKFGGNHQLRSLGALKLALASPWNTWVYSKVVDPAVLAAVLFSDLASIDAFECGNKRTAFLCAVAFIEANGRSFTMPDSEISAQKLRGFAERGFGETRSPNGCVTGSAIRAAPTDDLALPHAPARGRIQVDTCAWSSP